MVDVWWGIVERDAPGIYDFSAYDALFSAVAKAGLRLQAVMSFHAAGTNVGDTCNISLPRWVHAVGQRDYDIFYTDRTGVRNGECLSLACDDVPVFWGQTPLQLYEGFIRSFANHFQHLFGARPAVVIRSDMLQTTAGHVVATGALWRGTLPVSSRVALHAPAALLHIRASVHHLLIAHNAPSR
jgi:hypothetical protein